MATGLATILLLICALVSLSAACSSTERNILLGFKSQIKGSPACLKWEGKNCCLWPRISCDLNGSVDGINLADCGLRGTVPPVLGGLSKVLNLDLSDNPGLGGMIPSSFKSLYSLVSLRLSNTSLSGAIPDIFGGMPNLTVLFLYQNALTGPIPPSLALLPNLRWFDAYNNRLSGRLPEFKSASLVGLDLRYNKITGLPSTMKAVKNMLYLELSGNMLTFDSIKGIASIQNVVILRLSHCGLKGPIPSWLSKLRPHRPDSSLDDESLPIIDLSFNAITGSISPDFGNMELLSELYLQHNMISGIIPSSLGHLSRMERLDLNNNKISGNIPASLGNLPDLAYLNLSRNKLHGSIPVSFLNLSLDSLDLSFNKLTGQIPQGEALTKFNASSYQGNPGLCGYPLKAC